MNIKNIIRYIRHYGLYATVGHAYQLYVTDKKRFGSISPDTLPTFETLHQQREFSFAGEGKRPHVLYLIHYFYPKKKGGTERFTLNLASYIKKQGGNATVLVLEANEPLSLYPMRCGDIYYRFYEYEGIHCIGFRHKKAPLGLYYKEINFDDSAMSDFASEILEKEQIDLVHATYPQPFASFLLTCREMNVPIVETCTDFCLICHYSTLVKKDGSFCDGGLHCGDCSTYGCRDLAGRRKRAEELLSLAQFVTVPSKFVADVFEKQFPSLYFHVVPHGIADCFRQEKEHRPIRRFVFAGTLSRLKGADVLLDAFSRLEGDYTLAIYGDGDKNYVEELKKKADKRVRFMGAVGGDKMPEIYREADCVVVPSVWYETYNFSLREALASGCFGICSRIGAMPEIVREGENGYTFRTGDAEDLLEKLKALANKQTGEFFRTDLPTGQSEGDFYLGLYQSLV